MWVSESDIQSKEELVRYYISTWGGIRRNTPDKIRKYTRDSADQLIAAGKDGVASWSKALVIRDPNTYAIFDARVSVSLNCIQIIYKLKQKSLYPLLSSRNHRIVHANNTIKQVSNNECWARMDNSNFYANYLSLLEKVSTEARTNISTVEMMLFSKAEELANKIL